MFGISFLPITSYTHHNLIILSARNMNNLKLVSHNLLDKYPSGSTVNYLNNRFYIMGDDASEIIVLNKALQEEERIAVFTKGSSLRSEKKTKADIEASLIVSHANAECILFFGSGSLTPHRDSAFLFNPITKAIEKIDYSQFYYHLRSHFSQLNIEAATLVNGHFLLGIRANTSNPNNFLAVTSSSVFAPLYKRKIEIKLPSAHAIGISGMDYDEANDRLFITFSSEDTSNTFDDGKVGDSYLAIVEDVKRKLANPILTPDSLIKLADVDVAFKEQKIEGITVIASKQLLLVADDDLGNTRIFNLNF